MKLESKSDWEREPCKGLTTVGCECMMKISGESRSGKQ